MTAKVFPFVLLATAFAAAAAAAPKPTEPANPRTAYFSTGDNQDLLWLPLDSPASIDAVFDALQKSFRVERVWWRGGQDEIWGKHFVLREENRLFAPLWQWWKHLAYEGVGTNRLAVRAAHERGQKIWLAHGLFDHGSAADVGYVGFPYAIEDRLRVDHPDWTPVNKHGTWHQGGPVEFCYPEARKTVIDYLSRAVKEGGYDGIAFLTYAENYGQRYEDEFGYNPPIVAEFKKRHGVDIRTQPFDRQSWRRLRGEYLTQFLRELRQAVNAHGAGIAVAVDGKEPHKPCLWNVDGGVRTAGNWHLDLETWVREGLVDEITLWSPAEEAAIRKLADLCKNSRTHLSVFRTRGELPAGTPRLMFLGSELESGFDSESYIDWPDEKVSVQPAQALRSPDPLARRRLLTAALKKKQDLPTADVSAATRDPDLFVCRQALRILGERGDAKTRPSVEAALEDPENSVRCQAGLALGRVAGGAAVDRLFQIVARKDSTFQFNFRAVPEALQKLKTAEKIGPEELAVLVRRSGDADVKVREAALYCLLRIGAPATTAGWQERLNQVLKDDSSPYIRELALANLASSFGPTAAVLAAVKERTRDPDAVVGMRATVTLARLHRQSGTAAGRQQAVRELGALFRQYGDGCRRPDSAWGWREVGNALLEIEPEGRAFLTSLIEQKKDRRLAILAWRVVYVRQADKFYRVTEAEDATAHARYPFPDELPRR